MNTNPQIYHGEWWVPAVADHDLSSLFLKPKDAMGFEQRYKGNLTYYGDEDTTLELYHYPSNLHSKHYHQNDVMWGMDANGRIFTLFNVTMTDEHIGDFSCTKFVVSYILIGDHVLSSNDARYTECLIEFPYLRNWAFHDNIIQGNAGTSVSYKVPVFAEKLFETLNEDGVWWRIWQGQTRDRSIYDLTIKQTTTLEMESLKPLSILSYMKQIEKFAQFLSIALYSKQKPATIKFIVGEEKQEKILLFKKDASVNPDILSLIKFELLKEKLPSMFDKWHSNFERIAPISSYLIDSLQKKSRFEVPDFLIIAQALDGYHKRFVNKKDGKDIQKYEDQISILLSQFEDVEAIRKCKINPKVLKDSRHKYSHLYPDEEKSLAVEGEDLFWLTEKCKILLTCCILNMIGLTNKEINLCCNRSLISQIIDSLPPEID